MKKSLTREICHIQRISVFIFSISFLVAALVIFWNQTIDFQKERLLSLSRLVASNLAQKNLLEQILKLQASERNDELRQIVLPFIRQNTAAYPAGYTVGYYSNTLDRVVAAVAPAGDTSNPTGLKLSLKDPGRKIWITKRPIFTAKLSRRKQTLTLKCYYPVLAKGEVIGHTFARTNIWAFSKVNRKLLLNLGGILLLGIVCTFLVGKKATIKIKRNIHRLTLLDPQKKFPPFDYSDFDKVAETNHKVFEDLITTEKAKTELLTNFPWGFCIVNSNGILININHKGLDLLGIKRDAVLHRGISALGREFTAVLRAFHEKKAIETELVIPTGGGDKKILLVNAFPLTINTGESGAMACFIDVTGQRRMQAMLEHMNRLSTVGEMISVIVHDIRNPLTVIKALAQLCYMKPEANYRLNCRKIDKLTEEINAYLGKILTFAKPIDENPAVFAVKEMFENVLILLQGKFNASQVEVESWIADPEPYIFVNQLDFQYVLYTFLNNANDLINGPGKIGFQVDYADNMVRIVIADSGKGLPEQELSQIWDTVITPKPKGMNVGLSMCKRLVQKYGGEIIATSQLEHGTVFTIILPIAKVEHSPHSVSV